MPTRHLKLDEKPFQAVNRLEQSVQLTDKNVVDMLQKHIAMLFPENGIEYWFTGERDFGKHQKDVVMPIGNNRSNNLDENVRHVVCYANSGSNEGLRIEMSLIKGSGETIKLASIKTFGGEAEAWGMARVASQFIENLFDYEELPIMLDVHEKLPKLNYEKTMIDAGALEGARLKVFQSNDGGLNQIQLLNSNGKSIYDKAYESDPNAYFAVRAIAQDIHKLFSLNGVKYTLDAVGDPSLTEKLLDEIHSNIISGHPTLRNESTLSDELESAFSAFGYKVVSGRSEEALKARLNAHRIDGNRYAFEQEGELVAWNETTGKTVVANNAVDLSIQIMEQVKRDTIVGMFDPDEEEDEDEGLSMSA